MSPPLSLAKGCRFVPLAHSAAFRRIGLARMRNHLQTRAEAKLLGHLSSQQTGVAGKK
jgi:hypothetical protein